ncbi:restriction endonuclease subunit S [Thalassotalea sp. Y01]|uniref:restriction endonuclease subunit S n=1 Tax=Thalassotalea sp. Y01 TaxID=2729613 RepID=UPI00145DD15A|nr:restriction endonuclease subunit S [Thalassotalea sp. Y01]NMP15871.1 type I restriction endonuclease subunit S [Thalassotalea sp. Y01]
MLDMEAIKNFSIDKSDWKKVKFGDVVFEPKESVKDPVSEGIEHVVGLEHIDSEDMHLRRSASIEESTTFTKKFSKGDVLFGRRRAYLKKAAKAEFEGICSGDITVMRARDELLVPELLPFIVNNDNFFDFAVKHSAGGLSPRVKFKDLCSYEFKLPSKKSQIDLVALLSSKNDSIEKTRIALTKAIIAKKSLTKFYIDQSEHRKKIKELGNVITGNTPSTKNDEYWGGNVDFVTPADIDETPFISNVERNLTQEGALKSRKIPKGSILTVCIGSTIGKVAIATEDCCTNQQINSLIPFPEFDPLYILYLLKFYKSKILANTGVTAVPIINKTEFESITLPILNFSLIKRFVSEVIKHDHVISDFKDGLQSAKELQKQLNSKVF